MRAQLEDHKFNYKKNYYRMKDKAKSLRFSMQ